MPRSYWDYDSVNIQWGALENYEVVRKIGNCPHFFATELREIDGNVIAHDKIINRSGKVLRGL
jgi:hypothetical protein